MRQGSNLPVIVGPVLEAPRERAGPRQRTQSPKATPYDAQLLGQDGVRRGLKGGAPVLQAAREAYLDTEYSGSADRRPAAGRLSQAKV